MTPRRFKAGDRVVGSSRNPDIQGRKGTVKYESGGLYWVTFDDTGTYSTGLNPWWLEPLPAGQDR
jgi:hypothetical protein